MKKRVEDSHKMKERKKAFAKIKFVTKILEVEAWNLVLAVF